MKQMPAFLYAPLRGRGQDGRKRLSHLHFRRELGFRHILVEGEGPRMVIARLFLAGLVASTLTLAFDGDSFTAKFEALPQAVRETAKAHMENAFPVSISSAKGEQGWDYQINTRVDGKYHDLVIDDKGKLVAVKDETDLASLPAAAKATIEKQGATSNIVTLEKVTEGGHVSYHAIMKDDAQGTNVQVRVSDDGTLKSTSPNGPGK